MFDGEVVGLIAAGAFVAFGAGGEDGEDGEEQAGPSFEGMLPVRLLRAPNTVGPGAAGRPLPRAGAEHRADAATAARPGAAASEEARASGGS